MCTTDKFINKVRQYIIDKKLFEGIKYIVVGVSGGADSVCLYKVLLRLQEEFAYNIEVVHVNHCLRGDEADGDEKFVRELCEQHNTKCIVIREDIKKFAKEKGLTEEEAGRMVRYKSFVDRVSLYKDEGAVMAVAHNMNDTCETMLFNLFRGSGLKGLSGINMKNNVGIGSNATQFEVIRPLLCVDRDEIEKFLLSENISFRTDRTNLEDAYTRNKIRHNVLSYAKDNINNKAVLHIAQAVDKIREADEFIEDYTLKCLSNIVNVINNTTNNERAQYVYTDVYNHQLENKAINDINNNFLENDIDEKDNNYQVEIDINKLLLEKNIIQKRVIRKALEKVSGKLKDMEEIHIEYVYSLITKQTGRKINLPYNMIAKKSYDKIIIFKSQDLKKCERNIVKSDEYNIVDKCNNTNADDCLNEKIEIGKEYYLKNIDKYISFNVKKYKKNERIPKNNYTKWFDYDKIYNVILLRNCCEGDYITINTDGKRKSLKDYYKDCKIALDNRKNIPLIADGNKIMWVIGYRTSETYRIDDNTKTILEVILSDKSKDMV